MQQYLQDIIKFISEHFSNATIWNIEITNPNNSTDNEGTITISYTDKYWNKEQYLYIEKEKFNKSEHELLDEMYPYKNIVIWSEY